MKITWDEIKKANNPTIHEGVTFEEAATVLNDLYALVAEDGTAEGEQRFKLLGKSAKGRILIVIYSYREQPEGIRIISAWKATGPAKRQYEQQRP